MEKYYRQFMSGSRNGLGGSFAGFHAAKLPTECALAVFQGIGVQPGSKAFLRAEGIRIKTDFSENTMNWENIQSIYFGKVYAGYSIKMAAQFERGIIF
jgi:hypothetical protein